MNHLKTFEVFSLLGSLAGKAAGMVNKSLPKINYTKKSDKSDDDLAQQIYKHLQSMSTTYNRSGDYNEKSINKSSENWYYFMDKVFSNSGDLYKVDMIKHIDHKTDNSPEYTITISKSGTNSRNAQRMSGGPFQVRDTVGGKHQLRTYTNNNIKSSTKLKVSQTLAKKIFSLAENIYSKVTKNDKDDARGK